MNNNLTTIKKLFQNSRKSITAIGDETRQQIIATLLNSGEQGARVGEITQKTRLSRPAVSHHLKILKDADLISTRKLGTMNYYFLHPNRKELDNIKRLCDLIIIEMDKGR